MNDKKKGKENNKNSFQPSKKVKGDREFRLADGKTPIYEIGDFIDKGIFSRYKKAYLKNSPNCNEEGEPVQCHLFGLGNVLKLIHQPGCHGLRIYYGKKKKNGKWIPELMLVGVYQDGNDMLDHTLILDNSLPCPTYCPDDV